MLQPSLCKQFEKALQSALGQAITVTISPGESDTPCPANVTRARERVAIAKARAKLADDPNVIGLQQHFNATIQPDSITVSETEH